MTIKYYRSAAAYDAFAAFERRFKEHLEACRQFATRFDAKPIVQTDAMRAGLLGVTLNNWPHRDDADLWRKPDRARGGYQTPRTGRGIPRERRDEAEQLAERWKERPDTLDRAGVWESLGIDWGVLLFAGMTHHVDHTHKCVWIATSIELSAEYAAEVMASEYETAVAVIEADEKGES